MKEWRELSWFWKLGGIVILLALCAFFWFGSFYGVG